jgi:hypothetical protein
MPFSCGTLLNNIDINCQKLSGGIKKVLLVRRSDVSISFVTTSPLVVSSISASNTHPIKFVINDGITGFTENGGYSSGLSTYESAISIEIPSVDSNLNKLESAALIPDLCVMCLHSNGTVTITGYNDADIVVLDYDANSGTGLSEKSSVNINITSSLVRASITLDDTSLFTNPNIFD